MRVTAIPAQVTTVEDRITGNLNLVQLILLCTPIFAAGLLFAIVPPVMHLSSYKMPLIVLLVLLCGTLAIRFKGKLVLFWIAILLRYWLRPRYYVFNKHSTHGRKKYNGVPEIVDEEISEVPVRTNKKSILSFQDITKVQELIENPAANLAFESRKGGLYVRITEIKQEV
jgi:hypothetical protein